MAVTVYEIGERNSAKRADERRYERRFYVSLGYAGGPEDAEIANGVNGQKIPGIGDPHLGAPQAVAEEIRPEPVEGIFGDYIVTVVYSTTAASGDQDDLPTERPADIQWDSIFESMAIDASISDNPLFDGKPIVNSAGQPFDPPYEISVPFATLRVVRNETAFSAFTALAYTGKLNSDTFLGQSPLVAKCTKIAGRRFFEQNAYWWEVTYEFLFRPPRTLYQGTTPIQYSGHSLFALDNGLMQLDAQNNLVPCVDTNGNQVTQPALLDGAGHQEPASPNPNPNYMVYQIAKAVPFAPLGLGGI